MTSSDPQRGLTLSPPLSQQKGLCFETCSTSLASFFFILIQKPIFLNNSSINYVVVEVAEIARYLSSLCCSLNALDKSGAGLFSCPLLKEVQPWTGIPAELSRSQPGLQCGLPVVWGRAGSSAVTPGPEVTPGAGPKAPAGPPLQTWVGVGDAAESGVWPKVSVMRLYRVWMFWSELRSRALASCPGATGWAGAGPSWSLQCPGRWAGRSQALDKCQGLWLLWFPWL